MGITEVDITNDMPKYIKSIIFRLSRRDFSVIKYKKPTKAKRPKIDGVIKFIDKRYIIAIECNPDDVNHIYITTYNPYTGIVSPNPIELNLYEYNDMWTFDYGKLETKQIYTLRIKNTIQERLLYIPTTYEEVAEHLDHHRIITTDEECVYFYAKRWTKDRNAKLRVEYKNREVYFKPENPHPFETLWENNK